MVLMDAATIYRWISRLGHPYTELVSSREIPEIAIKPLFDGPDNEDLTMSPGDGIDLWFGLDKRLKKIQITLTPIIGIESTYKGALPLPLHNHMTRALAREAFGTPIESKGEWKIPGNGGKVSGGWDKFKLQSNNLPEAELIVGYNISGLIDGVVFQLSD